MRAFRDVSIFPTYATTTAIVAWKVDPSIKDSEFYVYRKYDGGAEWELLNEEPVYGTSYADSGFMIKNKLQVPAYRVLAIAPDGKEYDSPEVELYSHTGRKAYGVAHHIIKQRYLQARADGIPVLYYPLIRNGKMTSTLDEATGQRMSAACSADEDDVGTMYSGGFYRPFLTFVRLLDAKKSKENILDEGVFDESVQQAEFLAYPPVRAQDMVVDVTTDRRWIIGDSIEADLVKSTIPVGYKATISLQDRNQDCYRVSIPDNYPELVRKLTMPEIMK